MFPCFSRIRLVPAAFLLAGLCSPAFAQQPQLGVWKEVTKEVPARVQANQETEVTVEFRLVSVPPDFADRIGSTAGILQKECPSCTGCPILAARQGPVFLSDTQLRRFLEAIQGDVRTGVVQAPKVTLDSGQEATCRVGEEQAVLKGLDLSVKDGRLCAVPKTEMVYTGIRLDVRPVVSADKRYVRMSVRAVLRSMDNSAPRYPVKLPVALAEGDPEGKLATCTRVLQEPRVQELKVDETFVLADGRTALLDAGTRLSEGRYEYGPPVLSTVPYLDRLFKNVSYGLESEQVLLLVTPRIIVSQEAEERRPPSPQGGKVKVTMKELMRHFTTAYKEGKREEAELWAQLAVHLYPEDGAAAAALHLSRCASRVSQPAVVRCVAEERAVDGPAAKECCPKVAALLAKYQAACAAGRRDEARQCAVQALALDPTCFRQGR